MRLISFQAQDGKRIGLISGDKVIDLTAVDVNAPRDIQSVIQDGSIASLQTIADKASDAEILNYDNLQFNIPISAPGKILCLGLNYMEHVNEGIFEKQPFPTIFMRSKSSMVAHNEPIIRPSVSKTLDYEAELALIVGKTSRHLTVENALDVVAGYSCANDGSVREYQRHTIQWTMGKNFDKTGPLGPVFVTADELPDGAKNLDITCRLNGETVQSSNTDMMIFPVVETLVYITEGLTLEPGDIILMGTPSGVGHARTPQLWMCDSDVVEVEIENVGLLRNVIKDEVTV
ncbi:MAG: FAA hydrolase family protein [Alphaproteobacteria bacterium]|nr:FAA hydrolase family protein [Alphaproteobacteria bacterium]